MTRALAVLGLIAGMSLVLILLLVARPDLRPDIEVDGAYAAWDGTAEDLARALLSDIQPQSTEEDLEYCGSIVERPDGSLYATGPFRGDDISCTIPVFDSLPVWAEGDTEIADYHTHAGYVPGTDSEVPSIADMDGNAEFNIPGYVSTPGGRFWVVAADGESARQICSAFCLPSDPDYTPEFDVPMVLTREANEARDY
ncbi:MAG: DUF4329 domain-containing protein [Shimia sp.]